MALGDLEDATETPDGVVSVILRGGPWDGAHDALPPDSIVFRNEVHIPAPGKMCIYQKKKSESNLPTYRHVRDEPVYAVET